MYIEAVPGAGKTAVLTERCCALVNKGIKPNNILCVTFTNKAKDELKARLTKKAVLMFQSRPLTVWDITY